MSFSISSVGYHAGSELRMGTNAYGEPQLQFPHPAEITLLAPKRTIKIESYDPTAYESEFSTRLGQGVPRTGHVAMMLMLTMGRERLARTGSLPPPPPLPPVEVEFDVHQDKWFPIRRRVSEWDSFTLDGTAADMEREACPLPGNPLDSTVAAGELTKAQWKTSQLRIRHERLRKSGGYLPRLQSSSLPASQSSKSTKCKPSNPGSSPTRRK